MEKDKQKKLLTEVMNEDTKDGLYNNKPFTTGSLRKITDACEMGYISYGRMVEMINEIAIKWHENHIVDAKKMVKHHIVDINKMITAVEWFYQRILAEDIKAVFEKAKAMEKEQRIKDYNAGFDDAKCNHINDADNYANEIEYIQSRIDEIDIQIKTKQNNIADMLINGNLNSK
jgi:hypothetical protein